MGNYTIFGRFENPRRGKQARNLTTHVPKILDLKSSSEPIFSKNCRWLPLHDVLFTSDLTCDVLQQSSFYIRVQSMTYSLLFSACSDSY